MYPTNYPKRDYQFSIVRSCIFYNTLVCLPTGLGKTFIAAVVMYNFLRWFPRSKVVFMAPTKPLVAQQIKACYEICGIPLEKTCELTGSVSRIKREEEYRTKNLFFVTPQVLNNDLGRGTVDPRHFSLLVFDEAHRATGNYAYVQVLKSVYSKTRQTRVVALSATPGNNERAVQQVIDNLFISRIEVRSDNAIDVRQYINTKKVQTIKVKLEGEYAQLVHEVQRMLSQPLQLLVKERAVHSADPTKLSSQNQLITQKNRWLRMNQGRVDSGTVSRVMSHFGRAISIAHGLHLLMSQGLVNYLHYLNDLVKAATEKKSRTKKQLTNSDLFKSIMHSTRQLLNGGRRHPKLDVLLRVIREHFERNKDSRAMIFTEYRDSVDMIHALLSRDDMGMVRAAKFIGQSTGKRGAKGLKQKDQALVVKQFREGVINTLVSTCIGEEGLDIGECDLIVCYDTSASPIRIVQRMGRTGRKRQGRCVVLLTEGKEADKYSSARSKGKSIFKTLETKKKNFRFYIPDGEPIVPRSISRNVIEGPVEIPEGGYEAALLKARPAKKAKQKKKKGSGPKTSVDDRYVLRTMFETTVSQHTPLSRHWYLSWDDPEMIQDAPTPSVLVAHSEASLALIRSVEVAGDASYCDMWRSVNIEEVLAPYDFHNVEQQEPTPQPTKKSTKTRAKRIYYSDDEDEDDDDILSFNYMSQSAHAAPVAAVPPRSSQFLDLVDDDDDVEVCVTPVRATEPSFSPVTRPTTASPVSQLSGSLYIPPPPPLGKTDAASSFECPHCLRTFSEMGQMGQHVLAEHSAGMAFNSLPVVRPGAPLRGAINEVGPKEQVVSVVDSPSSLSLSLSNAAIAAPHPASESPSASLSLSFKASAPPASPESSSSQLSLHSETPVKKKRRQRLRRLEENEHEVEAILSKQRVDGEWRYEVKWANCDEVTWERRSNLGGCEQLLLEFERRERPRAQRKKRPMLNTYLLSQAADVDGEDDDDLDEEEMSSPASWVVPDDEEIVYSGTPPSQDGPVYDAHELSPEICLGGRFKMPIHALIEDGYEDDEPIVYEGENGEDLLPWDCQVCGELGNPGIVSQCQLCGIPNGQQPRAAAPAVPSSSSPIPVPVMSPVIVLSNGELSSPIVNELRLRMGFETVASSMCVSSARCYVLSHQLCLVRCKAMEVCNIGQVLMNLRFIQACNAHVAVLIESGEHSYRVKRPVLMECVAQIALLPNVQLLWSSNVAESVTLISGLARRQPEDQLIRTNAQQLLGWKNQIAFLMSVPSLGIARSLRLLQNFPSMSSILAAPLAQLKLLLPEESALMVYQFINKK